jgi:hypothetical protein
MFTRMVKVDLDYFLFTERMCMLDSSLYVHSDEWGTALLLYLRLKCENGLEL